MPSRNVVHHAPSALILIDVINHFEFPDGRRILKNALLITPPLARLKERTRQARIPPYTSMTTLDNGKSNFSKLLEYCLRPDAVGRDVVERLRPDEEDYLVLKPMHSVSIRPAGYPASASRGFHPNPGRPCEQ